MTSGRHDVIMILYKSMRNDSGLQTVVVYCTAAYVFKVKRDKNRLFLHTFPILRIDFLFDKQWRERFLLRSRPPNASL